MTLTRQAKWQQQQKDSGHCARCGNKLDTDSKWYCSKCKAKQNTHRKLVRKKAKLIQLQKEVDQLEKKQTRKKKRV